MRKRNVDEILLVGGSSRTPKIQELLKQYFGGKEPTWWLNPDEVGAYVAAVFAGILSKMEGARHMVLLDVLPLTLTLTVDTADGVRTKQIPRNTVIPTKIRETISTAYDNQETITIMVYEGEKPKIKNNNLLGHFDITNITPAYKLVPQIEVTFEVNALGILEVSAKDMGTGKKINVTMTDGHYRLTADDIQSMIKVSFNNMCLDWSWLILLKL